MPGEVGLVAKVIETIISKFLDEDQIPEMVKRWKLKALKEECRRALIDNDWERLAIVTQALRDTASKP